MMTISKLTMICLAVAGVLFIPFDAIPQDQRSEGAVAVWGLYTVSPSVFANIARVAAGPDYSLAVTRSGKVLFWGQTDPNGAQPGVLPATVGSNMIDVAAGWFGAAMGKDGNPVVWGRSPYVLGGQMKADTGLSNLVKVISGRQGELWGIKEDRTAIALNSDYIPMCPMPSYSNVEDIAPMAINNNCRGWGYGLVLFRDGRVEPYGAWNGNPVIVPPEVQGSVAIAAGEHTCMVLKTNGTVVCWSIYTGSTTTDAFGASIVPPASATNVIAIAAGRLHYMALRADGTVVTWGYVASEPGVIDTPVGLSDVIQISAGVRHCLALKKDGAVVAWGSPAAVGVLPGDRAVKVASTYLDLYLLKLDGTVGHMGPTPMPPGLTNLIDLDSDPSGRLLGLRRDGTVVSVGDTVPVPEGLNGVAAVAVGGVEVNVALMTNHVVKGWGQHTPLVSPPDGRPDDHVLQDYPGVAAIDASAANVIVLTTNGEVRVWSWRGTLIPPAGLSDVVGVAIGGEHAVALKRNGTVVGWGTSYPFSEVTMPESWTNIIKVDADSVYCAGCIPVNTTVALRGDGTVLNLRGPFPPSDDLDRAFEISTSGYISAAIFVPPQPPSITRLCPPSGDPGTVVRFDGSGYLYVNDVRFNGVSATFSNDFNFVLYVTVPTGASTGPIEVVSPYGTATVDRFVVPNGLTPIETWRSVHFGSPANSGTSADLADPDGDAKPNLLEYFMNSGPNVSDTVPSLIAQRAVQEEGKSFLEFVVQHNSLAVDVTPHYEYTLSLDAPWQPILGSVLDAGRAPDVGCLTEALIKRVEIPAGASKFYLRYRLTRP